MGERASGISLEATLQVFKDNSDSGAPLTASEVAEELGCVRRTAYDKLEALAERGTLETKKVGARGRVWWRASGDAATGRAASDSLDRVQLDEFVDVVSDYAIFVLAPDGTVRTWNDGARRIKGYSESEIVGRHFSTFYTEEDREVGVPARNLEAAAEAGRTEDEGLRVRKDGSTFWAHVLISARYDDDGELLGFIKVTRDMTARHEYEQRLKREKDRFEALVTEVEDYAIFLLDANGTVQSWNEGARQIKGYEESEIRGEHFSTFYSEADRAAGVPERNLQAAAVNGRTEDEGIRVRKDGSTFWANVIITALYDEDGEVRGFAKVTRDMTDRYEYEQRLEAQRDELDALNEINSVIRDVDQALVAAGSRDEIDEAVCDRLADSEPFAAAWIGEYSDDHDTVTTRACAGLSDGHVEAIQSVADDRDDAPVRGLGVRALRTGSVQSFSEGWPDTLGESGSPGTSDQVLESGVMIPLVYEEVEYGVLAVYADTASAFEDRQVAVLREMGETISHAIASVRRKERARTLTALQESTRELIYADTHEGVGDVVVEAVTADLALAEALVYLFDTSENKLVPVSASFPIRSFDGTIDTLAAGDESPVWTSFVDGEPRLIEHTDESMLPISSRIDRQTLGIPLGEHGILVVGTAAGESFDEETRNLVGLVGTTAEAAFDRVESEVNLRERDEILQQRNQRLQRLNQINSIIRGVNQALVEATTREEVERVVCQELTTSDRFRFAWIGGDDGEGRLSPRAWSGNGRDYLDTVSFETDEAVNEPAVRTARSGTVTAVTNVAENLRDGEWRTEAFSREFQSAISVPLAYGSVQAGVLTVYADRPAVFNEMEQNVFGELGDTIANTLHAVDTRQSLLRDEWVEVELHLEDPSRSFLSRIAATLDGGVSYEGFVPVSGESARLFFTVSGADPETVRELLEESVAVASNQLVASDGDDHLFEAVVDGSSIPATLLSYGASLRALEVGPEGTTIVAWLPKSRDVREFMEAFRESYEGTTLVARRRRERPDRTPHEIRGELNDALTDRQLEVLQTAFYSGFFASPRRASGRDIADVLGVSQPTVTEHLRAAQSTILELLLAEPSPARAP